MIVHGLCRERKRGKKSTLLKGGTGVLQFRKRKEGKNPKKKRLFFLAQQAKKVWSKDRQKRKIKGGGRGNGRGEGGLLQQGRRGKRRGRKGGREKKKHLPYVPCRRIQRGSHGSKEELKREETRERRNTTKRNKSKKGTKYVFLARRNKEARRNMRKLGEKREKGEGRTRGKRKDGHLILEKRKRENQ